MGYMAFPNAGKLSLEEVSAAVCRGWDDDEDTEEDDNEEEDDDDTEGEEDGFGFIGCIRIGAETGVSITRGW